MCGAPSDGEVHTGGQDRGLHGRLGGPPGAYRAIPVERGHQEVNTKVLDSSRNHCFQAAVAPEEVTTPLFPSPQHILNLRIPQAGDLTAGGKDQPANRVLGAAHVLSGEAQAWATVRPDGLHPKRRPSAVVPDEDLVALPEMTDVIR